MQSRSMKTVSILMQIAATRDSRPGLRVLKRALIVTTLFIFGMAAAASACGDTSPAAPPSHPVHAEFSPGDGPDVHHGGHSDHCRQTAELCTAPGTAAMASSALNPSLPDAADALQYFNTAWSPLVQPWTTAPPPPPSLPLYLQTSRLLI